MKRGDKGRTTRSPTLSSFFRFNGLLPTFHRDTSPHDHRRSHRGRDGSQNKNRLKNADKSRHEHHTRDPVKITLQDLGHCHGPYYLAVKRGIEVVRLEHWVKERCQLSNRPPYDTLHVRFFADARELGANDLVGFHPSVWFRLVTPRDSDGWKYTDLDDGDKELEARYADELSRCIDSGNTVGQIRKLIARQKGIDDPDRVVIVARDGARVGSLQGDMWELRQVRSWFCRWLSIDVSLPDYYVILAGPWGRYLIHPSKDCYVEGALKARDVKKLLETCLLTNVDRVRASKLSIKRSQITLTFGGGRLLDHASIFPGAKVAFELPWYLEDGLAAEESWLLAATETCSVCSDDKKITELATRIASGCSHQPSTCRDCLGQWIHSSLDNLTWDRLKCPDCPELLNFDSVRRYALKEDFDRYDTLATRAALESIPNFRWCLSASCESGQMHDPTCPRFKCTACRSKHCILHNVPWHSGETCEAYDRRNRRRKKDEKASEDMIKETTKLCPECKQPVHKWTGCNHITCKSFQPFPVPVRLVNMLHATLPLTEAHPGVCGHEWCYLCLAPFRRNPHGFVYCRHNPGCTDIDPFADHIIDEAGNIIPNMIPAGRRRRPGHDVDRVQERIRDFLFDIDIDEPVGGAGVPERMRDFHARRAAAFMPPPAAAAEIPRRERAPGNFFAWMERAEEEIVDMVANPREIVDGPLPRPRRPRVGDLHEEDLDHAAIGLADLVDDGPPGNQNRRYDAADAWVRTWMRIEDAMFAEMARNLRLPLDPPVHFGMHQ